VSNSHRNILLFCLKLLVTAGCLWWLSRYVDLKSIFVSLDDFSVPVILVGIVLHTASYLAGSLRWWILFRHLAGAVSFGQILPSYYLGVFFNNMFPSAYGGDVARSARLFVSGMSGSALVGSAVVDRLLGLAAVISLGGLALLFTDIQALGVHTRTVFLGGAATLLLALWAILFFDWSGIIHSRYGRRWPRLHAVLSCFEVYRRAPWLILQAFLLSLVNQLLVLIVYVLLAQEAGVAVPVTQLVAILMVVFLIASLPVSLGGLGPREGALMALLMLLGVEPSAVLALSIAYLLVLWSSALPGLFMLFVRPERPPENV
jgi:hypothetical protein